jgi:soluble lytic murein transglycosylase-like protein
VLLITHGKMLVAATAVAAVVTAFAPAGQAAEQVTLANGYALRCDHHAQVEGHVRLYMSPGEDDYIQFSQTDIVGIDEVADQLAEPTAQRASTEPAAKPLATLTAADLDEMLAAAGRAHNLDVDLLASVVKAESNGNARAVSRAGAQGLMQLMPQTAAGLGVHDSFRADENVRGGSAYLDALLTRYDNNLALALAAYNAGPEAVDRYRGIPPYRETRLYVARVIHEFNRRALAREAQEDALAHRSEPAHLR